MSNIVCYTTALVAGRYIQYPRLDRSVCQVSDRPPSDHVENYDEPWSRSVILDAMGFSGFGNGVGLSSAVWWQYPVDESQGARSCAGLIEGYVLDEDDNPLSGCLVKAFTVADGIFQGQVNSNDIGFFRMGTFAFGSHVLVASRDEATPLSGASVDTVTPV